MSNVKGNNSYWNLIITTNIGTGLWIDECWMFHYMETTRFCSINLIVLYYFSKHLESSLQLRNAKYLNYFWKKDIYIIYVLLFFWCLLHLAVQFATAHSVNISRLMMLTEKNNERKREKNIDLKMNDELHLSDMNYVFSFQVSSCLLYWFSQ